MLQRWSILNHRETDLEGWHALRRIALFFAYSGWTIAFFLALCAADLALWHAPQPVTFLSVYHGGVRPLKTMPAGSDA